MPISGGAFRAAILALAAASATIACEPAPQKTERLPTGFERLGLGAEDVPLQSIGGKQVRWAELAGPPRALFFGFTHCPDVCPTTVMELGAARARQGARGKALQIDFVTVDPARDTPEKLKQYFESFDLQVRAYAGDDEATRRIADAFRVSYEKRPLEAGEYTMDHTASVYLIDRAGRVVDQIPFGAPPEEFDRKLRSLLGA